MGGGGKGKESRTNLGRGRRAFSLLFAQEWGAEADGVRPHGGHRPRTRGERAVRPRPRLSGLLAGIRTKPLAVSAPA